MKYLSSVVRLLLLFSLTLFSLRAGVHRLSIDQIVEIALKQSPDIDSSHLDFERAIERTKAAKSYYLPLVDLSADAGRGSRKLENRSREEMNLLTGSVGASQLLYDFGKTAGRIESSREESMAYRANLQQIISNKIYTVKRACYDILKARSIIDVQHKNVTLQEQQLNRARKFLLSGIKTIIDVSDAEVQVEQARLDLENAKYDLELKRAVLEEEMGSVPYGGSYIIRSEKLPLPDLSRKLPAVRRSLTQLESYAFLHRYALQRTAHDIRSARSLVKSNRGAYYPELSAAAGYSAHYVPDTEALALPAQEGQVTLRMRWNLFSGYRTDAKVQEAKIAVLRASSELQTVKLAIKHQVIESYIGVRRNKKNVFLSESIAKAALKKLEQAQKRYENDLSDYVELQDAQQGYIQSLSDLVSAYYDYFIALAQLDHATGR